MIKYFMFNQYRNWILQNNFKIQATRLQHEIEDIRRRVEHAKMKLTGEMKVNYVLMLELRILFTHCMHSIAASTVCLFYIVLHSLRSPWVQS